MALKLCKKGGVFFLVYQGKKQEQIYDWGAPTLKHIHTCLTIIPEPVRRIPYQKLTNCLMVIGEATNGYGGCPKHQVFQTRGMFSDAGSQHAHRYAGRPGRLICRLNQCFLPPAGSRLGVCCQNRGGLEGNPKAKPAICRVPILRTPHV